MFGENPRQHEPGPAQRLVGRTTYEGRGTSTRPRTAAAGQTENLARVTSLAATGESPTVSRLLC
jgi:hypothetical protein